MICNSSVKHHPWTTELLTIQWLGKQNVKILMGCDVKKKKTHRIMYCMAKFFKGIYVMLRKLRWKEIQTLKWHGTSHPLDRQKNKRLFVSGAH